MNLEKYATYEPGKKEFATAQQRKSLQQTIV
jgi:hypothetical protein